MIKIGIQYFGGRGGGGSGGARGGRGGVEVPNPQTSSVPWDTSHTARQDYYDVGNFKDLKGYDFRRDLANAANAPEGSTARIRYADKTETYARKTSESRWTTDTGRTLTNNDLASAAHDTTGAHVRLNTMVKKKKR